MKPLNRILKIAAVAGLVALVCGGAFAAATEMPWESGLQGLQKALTGPLATSVGVIAMFAAGAMLIFGGEMSDFTRRMLLVVMALAIILTGNKVVSYFRTAMGGVEGALIGWS